MPAIRVGRLRRLLRRAEAEVVEGRVEVRAARLDGERRALHQDRRACGTACARSARQTIAAAAPSVVGQQSKRPNGDAIIGAFSTCSTVISHAQVRLVVLARRWRGSSPPPWRASRGRARTCACSDWRPARRGPARCCRAPRSGWPEARDAAPAAVLQLLGADARARRRARPRQPRCTRCGTRRCRWRSSSRPA